MVGQASGASAANRGRASVPTDKPLPRLAGPSLREVCEALPAEAAEHLCQLYACYEEPQGPAAIEFSASLVEMLKLFSQACYTVSSKHQSRWHEGNEGIPRRETTKYFTKCALSTFGGLLSCKVLSRSSLPLNNERNKLARSKRRARLQTELAKLFICGALSQPLLRADVGACCPLAVHIGR